MKPGCPTNPHKNFTFKTKGEAAGRRPRRLLAVPDRRGLNSIGPPLGLLARGERQVPQISGALAAPLPVVVLHAVPATHPDQRAKATLLAVIEALVERLGGVSE